ncbi:unnamed protein product [marine sediment metagenome]|uniref:Uncharacterized protein n=1 Tax=marine sediment metagenome TaxID=412755 RepID=X1P1E8_9ZZZZ
MLAKKYPFRARGVLSSSLRTYISTEFITDFLDITNPSKLTDTIEQGVIAFRAMGGLADTDLPSFAEYKVGGMNTVRGYDSNEFSGEKV